MAWTKPDYKITKDNTSSYNLIQHEPNQFGIDKTKSPIQNSFSNGVSIRPEISFTEPGKGDKSGRYYYKNTDEKINSSNNIVEYYNCSDNKFEMASARYPASYNSFRAEQQGGYGGSQTYRDDPRYGSATRRKQHASQDNDLALNLDTRVDGVNSRNQAPDYAMLSPREKPWLTHRSDMVDPRTGNNSHHTGLNRNTLKHGGALLFIRFAAGSGPGRTDNIGVACQSFLRSKTSDMGGKFLGIAKSVYDFGFGGSTSHHDALGVYHFPSKEKAKLFFQYDNILRQPDFPPPYGHAEIWTVSNAYLPDNLQEYNTFLLSEVMLHHGTDKREFFDVFQRPFEKFLSENEVMPFVVCSYGSHDRECLRRHAYPHSAIVTCHLFKGPKHLNWLTDQEMYLKYRSLHNQMADERCSVFTIERDLCP